ncbi:glycosyltransferase family 4 protein [Methylobacterium iners]|uniref:D-inositol-3-phosphate glycosyltransferase n=1 Tax=Methylobacterium iners TaxID=418707 RepID=A0ABQ4S7Y5_9HYPH|nr:glycosyltransferase family 4 protein [Methylobacterium iners]GJD97979.1 D-inositol-3-phosphate glycosyltransferase [Methylobacterium iners]
MDPKQIVFPFLGSDVGGSHVSCFTLAQQLESEGISCIILCIGNSAIADEARRLGLHVEPTNEPPALPPAVRNSPLVDLRRLPKRVRLLRTIWKPSTIIHCNDIAALQAWILPARLANLPILYHHRSINKMRLPNRKLIQKAAGTIVISDECRANVAFLPDAQVRQIVNPFQIQVDIDRDDAKKVVIKEFGLPEKARLIGFVGNFWPRKRPSFFLEIAKLMTQVDENVYVVIFGRDGEIKTSELVDQADALQIGHRTVFAGFRTPGEKNIAALDLLLATAVREPFGRTLVEAILVGTPYLATDDAGHTETARRWGGGRLIPIDADATEFAARGLEVLHGKSPALFNAARRSVAFDVSPAGHTRAVTRFYSDVLSSNRLL